MKDMIKQGLILALYTSIACVTLALVNNLTQDAIAAGKDAELRSGLALVFSQAETFEKSEVATSLINGVTIDGVYLAKTGNTILGTVVKATGATYDKATILVGLTKENTLTSIEFLELTDTPGFGQKAKEPTFKDQFINKPVEEKLVLNTNVDAITGSTMSSNGIVTILNAAIEAGKDALKGAH